MARGPSKPSLSRHRVIATAQQPLFIGVVIVALLLTGAGIWLYQRDAQRLRTDRLAELALIARLKVEQIVDWRNERIADAEFSTRGPFFGQILAQWTDTPAQEELRDEILVRLHDFRRLPSYDAALLATVNGTPLISTQPTIRALDNAELATAALAVRQRRPELSNFFRLADGSVRISVIASLTGPDGVVPLALY